MDIHSNLEYLCRVCAANTKGKHSVAECVYILKTADLKDKLDKFLYLKVSENDSLPKVLCKSCFRQVEATASLSKIAKHTQQVFRDFLLSNLPKGPSEFINPSEFTSSDFMGTIDANEKCKKNVIAVPPLAQLPLPPAAASLLMPQLSQPLTTTSRKDEVVVNVSVTDPLTRDNQQKMISNSQRRQSLLLDTHTNFTPKSIAQKLAKTKAFPRPIAPKPNQSIETLNATHNLKIKTPPLNFYPAKGQQQVKLQHPPQTTQITTFSSGGYVIGRINSDACDKEETKKITLPLAATAENILQQKRKNLVKALNNIKANNSGQISLLKSSQQKQAEAMQSTAKTSLNKAVNQTTEDELPEKIIIAAPKNRFLAEKVKKEPLNLSSKVAGSAIQFPPTNSNTLMQQQQEHINAFAATPPKTAFPEDILLGRVIRDMDLLKLILKALKWPVNKQNMELQLQRLKNSKFTDIMSDPNLLQDTDLTQLLGPYLAPVLLAAQALQQQQQQILKNTSFNQNVAETFSQPTQPKMTALEAAQAEINKSIPYKLPPETSVQLVPAIPEETEATEPTLLNTMINSSLTSVAVKREKQSEPQKRQRRAAAQRAKDSIVISDGEDTSTEEEVPKKSRQHSPKSIPNIQIELKPNFMSQFNLFNSSGGNEADELMALLLKQQAVLLKDKKMQRRRRNSVSNFMALPPSEFDALIDLDDDIVLMEPVTTTSSTETNSSIQDPQQQKTDVTNTFVIPSVPLITRPIIKRRKTVIHSPKNKFDLSIELKNKDPAPISSSTNVRNKEKLLEETINQVATGTITSAENSNQQNLSKTINNEVAVIAPTALTTKKSSQQKKMQNKSTLGQQLLEAIGLQKISPKIENSSQAEEASSSSLSNALTVLPNSKQSIQQIRSALKKSLKQAQEQQQQKKKELSSSNSNTVIQDADSTTKSSIKEIVVVEGKGNNNSDNSSSIIDVEDQIDKVTLMVRKNDEEQTSDQLTIKPTTANEEKNEVNKKSTSIKIQERRRTMLTAGSRGIGTRNLNENEKSTEGDQQQKTVANNDTIDEKDFRKMEKNDGVNISSSSATIANTSNETTATTNDEIVTPKRRGRKRIADKQSDLEAAETNEKDKVLPTLTEKSRTDAKSREEETETSNSHKNEEEIENNTTSSRPTRQSKTQSKYYKGPEKSTLSRRSLPSRTTRNRKYC